MGKRKCKLMMKKKSNGRSGQNDAGMSTIPCKSPSDRPDAVELRPMRKSYRIDRVQVVESPDGLPEGWIMEIRPRKRGQKTDKYYIDPVHGYGLLSKVDVFRYLQNKEEFQTGFRIKKIRTTDIHSTADESIQILRLRNRNQSSTKEPISNANIPQIVASSSSSWEHASTKSGEGYSDAACSTTINIKNLEQCIENISSQCCHEHITDDNPDNKDNLKPSVQLEDKKNQHPDECILEEKKNQPKKVSKLPKRIIEKADKEPARKSKRLAGATNDFISSNDIGKSSRKPKSKKIEGNMQTTMPKELHEEALQKARTNDDPDKKDTPVRVEIQDKLENLEPSPEQASQNQYTGLIINTSTIGDTQSDLDEYILDEKQNQSKNANRLPKRKIKNIETKSARTSKRLAGTNVDLLFNNDTEKGSIKPKSKKFEQSMQQTVPKDLRKGKLGSTNHIIKDTSQKENATESDDRYKKFATNSDVIQNSFENVKPSVEQASEGYTHSLVTPPRFRDSWSDPCIEFAFKTLTSDLDIEDAHSYGRIQEKPKNVQHSVEEASQKQLHVNPPLNTLAYGDSWSDPCIEFAFKTLTSDLDIEDVHIKQGTQEKLKNILQPSVEQASQKQQYTDPLAFGDSWSDPCIEFAFKTLTSDYSSLADFTSVQDYFHHKPFSSQCSKTTASVSALSTSNGKTQSPKNGEVSMIH